MGNQVYTGRYFYSATGEGVRWHIAIGSEENEEEFRRQFWRGFMDCRIPSQEEIDAVEVHAGVSREILDEFFSEQAIKRFDRFAFPGGFAGYMTFTFYGNLS